MIIVGLNMHDAFLCNYSRALGTSKNVAYQQRLVRAGRCIDCRHMHDQGTWVCRTCRVKRQAVRVKTDTTGRPVWAPSFATNVPDTLFGYPYIINNDMVSTLANGVKSIVFGDLSKYGQGMSKYNAKRTEVDGIVFASQKEAKRYQELKMLEKAGEISGLRLQPEFALQVPVDTPRQHLRTIGKYRADFEYKECNGRSAMRTVIEDVKGFKTPLYRWKKKHVEAQYGIQIREV